jgi:hypothetical protein
MDFIFYYYVYSEVWTSFFNIMYMGFVLQRAVTLHLLMENVDITIQPQRNAVCRCTNGSTSSGDGFEQASNEIISKTCKPKHHNMFVTYATKIRNGT